MQSYFFSVDAEEFGDILRHKEAPIVYHQTPIGIILNRGLALVGAECGPKGSIICCKAAWAPASNLHPFGMLMAKGHFVICSSLVGAIASWTVGGASPS